MTMINPVSGYDISKTSKYKKNCKPYGNMKKKILNVELKIVGNPHKTTELHGALSGNCDGLLHARVDRNMRILYEPDHEHRIIFLTDFLTHREMDKKCS